MKKEKVYVKISIKCLWNIKMIQTYKINNSKAVAKF